MYLNNRKEIAEFIDKEVSSRVTSRVMDAIRADARDAERKVRLYDRVSRHVGSFDHENMSLQEMATHAAKKLGVDLAEGADPVSAVEGYLKGREHAAMGTSASDRYWRGKAQDSAGASFLDEYLGEK